MALQHFIPGEFLDAGQQSIMNAEVTQEERNRFSRPAHPEAAQVMETATATLAMSTTGWTKARGGASSRARVTMSRLESVNDGVDGAVTISGEPQGCDLWSTLTGSPTLLFFVAWTTCE